MESNPLNRRSFFRKSALLGASAAGGAMLLPGINLAADAATGEAASTNVETPSLPFTLSIEKMPFENMPDYFGGGQGNPYSWVDFPICPVVIDGEYWIMYRTGDTPAVYRWKGTNIEDGKRQPDGAAPMPGGVKRPYMLGGMWYDESEKRLYAPMHCEYYGPKSAPMLERQIHLATSTDKGLTWRYEGPIVTRDAPTGPLRAWSEYSGTYWHGGDGDFFIYVDQPNGHVYLFSASYWWPKQGGLGRGFSHHHVSRCAFRDKMMPGKWQKFYNGRWDEPGLGGRASHVNAYYVMYNSYLGKYLGMTYGNGLAVCSDLSKQDWSPLFKIDGSHWGCDGIWAWHITAANKIDIVKGDRTLFLYRYWKADNRQLPTSLYKIELSSGVTPAGAGFAPEGVFLTPISSMDPAALCPCEPILDSADPVESRRTRRVYCDSSEMAYSGRWADRDCPGCFENVSKESDADKSVVQFSFKGEDVYWRAVKGPDRGRADVYIDDRFEKTVDCYASSRMVEQFAFIKTGLAPKASHTIEVVVRGDKGALASGTAISHVLFEHSADSHRASDGFSSIMGKNGWHYQQKHGSTYTDLTFGEAAWSGKKGDSKVSAAEIGNYHMVPGDAAAVRKWVAPHSGVVRVEGKATLDPSLGNNVHVAILQNEKEVWPSVVVSLAETRSHDVKLTVNKGDAICFVTTKSTGKAAGKVIWDPTITYVDSRD
jgi:hypothetical protein